MLYKGWAWSGRSRTRSHFWEHSRVVTPWGCSPLHPKELQLWAELTALSQPPSPQGSCNCEQSWELPPHLQPPQCQGIVSQLTLSLSQTCLLLHRWVPTFVDWNPGWKSQPWSCLCPDPWGILLDAKWALFAVRHSHQTQQHHQQAEAPDGEPTPGAAGWCLMLVAHQAGQWGTKGSLLRCSEAPLSPGTQQSLGALQDLCWMLKAQTKALPGVPSQPFSSQLSLAPEESGGAMAGLPCWWGRADFCTFSILVFYLAHGSLRREWESHYTPLKLLKPLWIKWRGKKKVASVKK